MPTAGSILDCSVILLFAARRLASNGPGTLLPCLRCCGQVVRKTLARAWERRSSESQTWSRARLGGGGTARQQAMDGRRIKRGGHRMDVHAAVLCDVELSRFGRERLGRGESRARMGKSSQVDVGAQSRVGSTSGHYSSLHSVYTVHSRYTVLGECTTRAPMSRADNRDRRQALWRP